MSQRIFEKHVETLCEGIDACLKQNLITPALILVYSAIDITSWLACDDPNAKVGKRFKDWVNQYMLPAGSLKCNAEDIYGARCGLLHTFTPESDLSGKGVARQISYAWGKADVALLEREIVHHGWTNVNVAVHVNELVGSWARGIVVMLQEMEHDDTRADRFFARAAKFFRTFAIGNDGKITKQDH